MRGLEARGAGGARPSTGWWVCQEREGAGGRRVVCVCRRSGRVAAVAHLEPDAPRVREVIVEAGRRRVVAVDLPQGVDLVAGDALALHRNRFFGSNELPASQSSLLVRHGDLLAWVESQRK